MNATTRHLALVTLVLLAVSVPARGEDTVVDSKSFSWAQCSAKKESIPLWHGWRIENQVDGSLQVVLYKGAAPDPSIENWLYGMRYYARRGEWSELPTEWNDGSGTTPLVLSTEDKEEVIRVHFTKVEYEGSPGVLLYTRLSLRIELVRRAAGPPPPAQPGQPGTAPPDQAPMGDDADAPREGDRDRIDVVSSWFQTGAGQPRRRFGVGEAVVYAVRLRNDTDRKLRIASTDFHLVVTRRGNGAAAALAPVADIPALLAPGEAQTFLFRLQWKPGGDPAVWTSSGIEFSGVEVEVLADLALKSDTHASKALPRASFYLDEFPPADWASSGIGLDIASYLDQHPLNDPAWDGLLADIQAAGFKVLFFSAAYYNWGNMEGKLNKPFNYWFPAGPGGDYHYTTPPDDPKLGATRDDRRKAIRGFVDLAHRHGLRVIAYMDVVGIYSPQRDFGDGAQAHALPADPTGWARLSLLGQPMRMQLPEEGAGQIGSWIDWGLEQLGRPERTRMLPPSEFALAACFSGPSGVRKVQGAPYGAEGERYAAWEKEGFLPEVVAADPRPEDDLEGSHHYHVVRQARHLMDLYAFDGLFLDDQGRLLMNLISVAATAADRGYAGVEPHDSTFGLCFCPVCRQLAGQGSLDDAARDSLANLVRHVRWQVKAARPDGVLISSDYYLPWESLAASEDLSSTDQFRLDSRSLASLQARAWAVYGKAVRCDWTPVERVRLPEAAAETVKARVDAALVLANGGPFWAKLDMLRADDGLWKWARRCQRMYAAHADVICSPGRRLLAHTNLLEGEPEARTGLARSPEGLIVSLWGVPPSRLVTHVVRTEVKGVAGDAIAPAERTVSFALGKGLAPAQVRLLDPDVDGEDFAESVLPPERWKATQVDGVTWLSVTLPALRVYSVIDVQCGSDPPSPPRDEVQRDRPKGEGSSSAPPMAGGGSNQPPGEDAGDLVWEDGFEQYAAESIPKPDWTADAEVPEADAVRVDAHVAASGKQSLRICFSSRWSPFAYRMLGAKLPCTLEMSVRTASNDHPGWDLRGEIALRVGSRSRLEDYHVLLRFQRDGTIVGVGGVRLGDYKADQWNHVRIVLECVEGNIQATYFVNNVAKGSAKTKRVEDLYPLQLALSSQGATVWFDDIRVRSRGRH